MTTIDSFIGWAEQHGWEISLRNKDAKSLPKNIKDRYSNIPKEYLEFLERIDRCISPDEMVWFICLDEYSGSSDLAFAWDEIESMSYIEGDEQQNKLVSEYWNKHLPIMLSVKDSYCYYAIDLADNIGAVIFGIEPEFEEKQLVASSFGEFLNRVMAGEFEM